MRVLQALLLLMVVVLVVVFTFPMGATVVA